MDKPKIYLSSPHMGEEELLNVQEAFATNWISPAGPFINQFENDLATYCGTAGAAVVQSGTAAIHLALRLLRNPARRFNSLSIIYIYWLLKPYSI